MPGGAARQRFNRRRDHTAERSTPSTGHVPTSCEAHAKCFDARRWINPRRGQMASPAFARLRQVEAWIGCSRARRAIFLISSRRASRAFAARLGRRFRARSRSLWRAPFRQPCWPRGVPDLRDRASARGPANPGSACCRVALSLIELAGIHAQDRRHTGGVRLRLRKQIADGRSYSSCVKANIAL